MPLNVKNNYQKDTGIEKLISREKLKGMFSESSPGHLDSSVPFSPSAHHQERTWLGLPSQGICYPWFHLAGGGGRGGGRCCLNGVCG